MAGCLTIFNERLIGQPDFLEERGDDLVTFLILFRDCETLFGRLCLAHDLPLLVEVDLPVGDIGGIQKDFLGGDRLDQSVQHILYVHMHPQRVAEIDTFNGLE